MALPKQQKPKPFKPNEPAKRPLAKGFAQMQKMMGRGTGQKRK